MTRARRIAAERRGRAAETLCALHLMLKGYRLLGRRVRTGFGELDLVAWRNGTLVVVEVKARPRADAAHDAISAHQRRRLAQAALAFAARHRLEAAPIRFDLMAVAPWRWPRHVRDAWREGDR